VKGLCIAQKQKKLTAKNEKVLEKLKMDLKMNVRAQNHH